MFLISVSRVVSILVYVLEFIGNISIPDKNSFNCVYPIPIGRIKLTINIKLYIDNIKNLNLN